MDLFEAITTRRSVRKFTEKDVSDQDIEKILDSARWAPTGGNMQPWEFIVIRDEQIKAKIVAATYAGYNKQTGPPQKWISSAPVIVFIGLHKKRTEVRYGEMGSSVAALDCAAAVQNMLLTVTALGLGATWVVGFEAQEIAAILDLDPDIEPFSLVPIGHPALIPQPPYRLPLEDITEYR